MTSHSTALAMGKIAHMGNFLGTGQLCPGSWADMPITSWVKLPLGKITHYMGKFAHQTWANLTILIESLGKFNQTHWANSAQLFNLAQQST